MSTKYMTNFQKEKLDLIHEANRLSAEIKQMDKRLYVMYNDLIALQERLMDLKEKNNERQ